MMTAGTVPPFVISEARASVPSDRPVVSLPFGLGAIGTCVYDKVARCGELHVVYDFFHDLRRYECTAQRFSAQLRRPSCR